MATKVLVVQEISATEKLSEKLKQDGRLVVQKLDQNNAEVQAAVWVYIEEEEIWRLCLATPLTDTKGPLFVYKLLQDILKEVSSSEESDVAIELANIAVVSPNLRLMQDMQHRYGRIEQEDAYRARRVDAPYIYRLMIDGLETEKNKNGKN